MALCRDGSVIRINNLTIISIYKLLFSAIKDALQNKANKNKPKKSSIVSKANGRAPQQCRVTYNTLPVHLCRRKSSKISYNK